MDYSELFRARIQQDVEDAEAAAAAEREAAEQQQQELEHEAIMHSRSSFYPLHHRPYSPPLVYDDPAMISSAPFPFYSPRTASPSPRPVSPIEVRPAWTPRTSSGRSKLMAESEKWESAEEHRERRNQRDYNVGALKGQRQYARDVEAHRARDARLQALYDSRENHRELVDDIGREGKEHAEELRRQHADAKATWKSRGKARYMANKNTERVREQMEKVHLERAAHVAARSQERREAEQERAREVAERVLATRARADRNRKSTEAKIRSSSAHELRVRLRLWHWRVLLCSALPTGVLSHSELPRTHPSPIPPAYELTVLCLSPWPPEQMRSAQVGAARERLMEREEEVREIKGEQLASKQVSRDGVAKALAPSNVREFKAQEQARKSANSARLRELSRSHLERARATFDDEDDRKRRLHDAVRRAATDGFGDQDKAAYSSVVHSGTSIVGCARLEGPHGFKHDLPSARSPAGRWLREYAMATLSRANSVVTI